MCFRRPISILRVGGCYVALVYRFSWFLEDPHSASACCTSRHTAPSTLHLSRRYGSTFLQLGNHWWIQIIGFVNLLFIFMFLALRPRVNNLYIPVNPVHLYQLVLDLNNTSVAQNSFFFGRLVITDRLIMKTIWRVCLISAVLLCCKCVQGEKDPELCYPTHTQGNGLSNINWLSEMI